jgi:hypothetical protein
MAKIPLVHYLYFVEEDFSYPFSLKETLPMLVVSAVILSKFM